MGGQYWARALWNPLERHSTIVLRGSRGCVSSIGHTFLSFFFCLCGVDMKIFKIKGDWKLAYTTCIYMLACVFWRFAYPVIFVPIYSNPKLHFVTSINLQKIKYRINIIYGINQKNLENWKIIFAYISELCAYFRTMQGWSFLVIFWSILQEFWVQNSCNLGTNYTKK